MPSPCHVRLFLCSHISQKKLSYILIKRCIQTKTILRNHSVGFKILQQAFYLHSSKIGIIRIPWKSSQKKIKIEIDIGKSMGWDASAKRFESPDTHYTTKTAIKKPLSMSRTVAYLIESFQVGLECCRVIYAKCPTDSTKNIIVADFKTLDKIDDYPKRRIFHKIMKRRIIDIITNLDESILSGSFRLSCRRCLQLLREALLILKFRYL